MASRAAKERCDAGYGVGTTGQAVYLDFKYNLINKYGKAEANKLGIANPDTATLIKLGKEVVKEEYGNLFDMYEKITGENPYEVPMRIYPAVHYTMGGLWVDYELMTSVKGLYALGEANFSDHGANRLGASALMQGLADGYFVNSFASSTHEWATGKILDLGMIWQQEQRWRVLTRMRTYYDWHASAEERILWRPELSTSYSLNTNWEVRLDVSPSLVWGDSFKTSGEVSAGFDWRF